MGRYLLKIRGHVAPTLEIQMGAATVAFRRVAVGGAVRMLADLDGHPGRDEAVRVARRSCDFEILSDLPEEIGERPAAQKIVAPKAPRPPRPPTPFEVAETNGWSLADFEGAGQRGDAGTGGGRSKRTGLTIAEMALCKPPAGWADVADRIYPWQVQGFAGPSGNFRPPVVPAKPSLAVEPDEAPVGAGELPPPPAPAPTAGEEPPWWNEKLFGPHGGPTEWPPEPPDGPDAAEIAPEPPKADVSAYGTPEDAARALVIVRERAGGGGSLTRNALNYHLGKAGLPRASEDAYQALIAASAAAE